MEDEKQGLTIEELAERVDVPVRTIRFYMAEGLLAGSGGRGKASLYGEEHLLRLMLIRLLANQHVPLKEIRDRLDRLSIEEVKALLAEDAQREAVLQQARLSPKEYISSLLDRARSISEPSSSPQAAAPAPPPAGRSAGDFEGAATIPAHGGQARDRSYLAGARASESWRRLELAPGVELHVRADTWDRSQDLIERLLDLAGAMIGHRIR